jgi:hypothetical protein
MAAQVLRCQAPDCGTEFVGRPHARTCSNRCRQALSRSTRVAPTLPPEHEALGVAEIAAGRLTPEDGLRWALFPEQMRARASVRFEGVAA